jgi:2,4-diketo-3-deoxy-L-fuconate hydrolase
MKLIRFGRAGSELPGVEIDGIRYDVSHLVPDYDERFFATDGLAFLAKVLDGKKGELPQVADNLRLGPPVARPSKIVCIGLNYADHARETGVEPPTEPVVFLKSTTAIIGPYDEVIIPKGSTKTDWEVELAVVIGKKCSYVSEKDARNYIAGYLLHNDISERAFQLERGGTWDKGKGCDTFAPLGPYFVTADEVADDNNMELWLKLNGKMMQRSNTSNFVFDIPAVIAYVSRFMTLLPGDIITTGTPPGVGLGLKPPQYLKPGDVMELGIPGLGEQRQVCKAFEEPSL